MQSLELKIPPPLLALLIGVAMYLLAQMPPAIELPRLFRLTLSIAIAVLGFGYSVAGAIAFHQAKTTVNPMSPEKASSLVQSGIYKITRNPMYVGLFLVLCGWTVFLMSPFAAIGPLGFMFYINRFQIAPEERALTKLFGEEYMKYKARVRAWF
ncbi:isoprenylcysteine carboxylmethyltransferase family protein [Undibacterium sp. Jales W-56]|uniref:methyltransferase family protein n=1 Tax=Undibacterium sp. Jales W-56 TaxID=2897325 RepID=UPI0021CECBAA|nr:isoprenylcysteine carboxylmethyltransferase family protein [Undibacterium sp. Jales W-56]MCU6434746.1 isoprenylcysteine carboxylmethyltransferase family protein [Undibacterium sp. Jales W-56]